jgi:peptidyl-prolyl cis-trans isomerase C
MTHPSLRAGLAAAALLLVSCKQKPEADGASPNAAAPVASSSLSPEQAKKVLAKVGDRVITLGDFAATIEHLDSFDRLRYQSAERRKELLDEMINVELLAQEAEAKGYDKDPFVAQAVREILRDAMLAEARKGVPKPADLPLEQVKAYFDAHREEYRDPERRRISLIVTADEASARPVL